MNIKLTRDSSGKFIPTEPDTLRVTDGDVRSMGEHHNGPIEDVSIFDVANKGFDKKLKRESENAVK